MTKQKESMNAADAQITVNDVELTFGPVCAELAREHDRWPDADEVRYRLAMIAKHGRRKLRRILAARRRYEAKARAEQFREVFGGSGKAA